MTAKAIDSLNHYIAAIKSLVPLAEERAQLVQTMADRVAEMQTAKGFRVTPQKEVVGELRRSAARLRSINTDEQCILIQLMEKLGL